jgi:hypothetical protein
MVKTPSTDGCCYNAIRGQNVSMSTTHLPDDCSEMSTINQDSHFNGLKEGVALALDILEERTMQHMFTKKPAILRRLADSGHVLLLSGLTLAAAFLELVFLPLAMLQSIRPGASMAILSALIVNLTIAPAVLYAVIGDKFLLCHRIEMNQIVIIS